MAKRTQRAIPKMISLFPQQIALIDMFIDIKGSASVSEVIRQAIIFYHKSVFPDYIYNKSAADLAKRKHFETVESIEKLSNEEYVEKFFPEAPFLSSSDGNKYFIIHWWANSVQPKLVSEVKVFAEKMPDAITNHENLLRERGPVLNYARANNLGFLFEKYGLVIPAEETLVL